MRNLALILILMILVAGCTTQAPPTPENGLVITEFYAEPTVVEEGEPVTFFLEVENKGDVTAEYVTAQLYGVEGMWYVDPTTVDAVTLKNIFECWITGAIAGTFRWDAFSWSFFIGNQACLRLLSQHPLVKWGTLRLEPPKPEQGKSYGDFELTQWRLYPPDLPEGVRQEFPITVHVTYAYKSNAVVNIMALNEREAKRMTQRGESISNPITVSNTKGPIQIRVERADAPIIVENPYFRPFGQEFDPNLINTFHTYNPYNPFFYTDTVTFFSTDSTDSYTFDERMFYYTIFNNLFFFSFWEGVGWSIDYYEDFVQKTTLKIKLENVGSGSPIFPSYRDAHGNVIEGAVFGIIRLEAPRGPGGVPTAWFENCLGTPYGNVVIIDHRNEELVRLKEDRTSSFGCTIGIDRIAWQNIPNGNILLVFDLFYMYDISKTIPVTVIGRRETRGLGGWIRGKVPTGPGPREEECEVITAGWDKDKANIGDTVKLFAEVKNCVYPISFEIKEHDPTIFLKDDYIDTVLPSIDNRDKQGTGQVSASWTIGSNLGERESEYQLYFNVKAANKKIGKSNNLIVETAGLPCSDLGLEACLERNECWWNQNKGMCKSCSSSPPSRCSDFHYEEDCGKCGFSCEWDNFNYCQKKDIPSKELCKVESAWWEDTEGNVICSGNKSTTCYVPEVKDVKLVVKVSNCDGDREIFFRVRKKRKWWRDVTITELDAERNGDLFSAVWEAESGTEGVAEKGKKYHFEVLERKGGQSKKILDKSSTVQFGGSASDVCKVEEYHWHYYDDSGKLQGLGVDSQVSIGTRVWMSAKLPDECNPNEVYFLVKSGDDNIGDNCFKYEKNYSSRYICECLNDTECEERNGTYVFIAKKEGGYYTANWVVKAEQAVVEEEYSYYFLVYADGAELGFDSSIKYKIKVKNRCYNKYPCEDEKDEQGGLLYQCAPAPDGCIEYT